MDASSLGGSTIAINPRNVPSNRSADGYEIFEILICHGPTENGGANPSLRKKKFLQTATVSLVYISALHGCRQIFIAAV